MRSISIPHAIIVCLVGKLGYPNSRTVLIRGYPTRFCCPTMMLAMSSVQFLLVPLPQHEQKGHIFCLPHHTPSCPSSQKNPTKKIEKETPKKASWNCPRIILWPKDQSRLSTESCTRHVALANSKTVILQTFIPRVNISEADESLDTLRVASINSLNFPPANLFRLYRRAAHGTPWVSGLKANLKVIHPSLFYLFFN